MSKEESQRDAVIHSTDDDHELMTRYQHGQDLAAFQQLVIRHQDKLLRYLLRLAGDAASADDASQRSWLKVIEVARNRTYAVRPDATFRTWLYTLARNCVVDEQRKLVCKRTVSLDEVIDSDASLECKAFVDRASLDPADQVVRSDLAKRVHSELRALPPRQREVITLWAAGFDPQEIATMTGTPRETVLSRKKYAIAKLRSRWQR